MGNSVQLEKLDAPVIRLEIIEKLNTPTIYLHEDLAKLATPVIRLEVETPKLSTPVIYLKTVDDAEFTTTAVLGEAVLGWAILGNGEAREKLPTPAIYLHTELQKLLAPVIELVEVLPKLEAPVITMFETLPKLDAPIIGLAEILPKLSAPVIYLECNHDRYTSEITKEATCTTEGERTFTCSDCGYVWTETISATGVHDYTSVVTDPTCTEQGYTTHTCSECGDSYVDSYVDALGHDWGEPYYSDEFTSGYGRKCNRCGELEVMEAPQKLDTPVIYLYENKLAPPVITIDLAAPVISIDGRTIRWDAVKGAMYYNVYAVKNNGSSTMATCSTCSYDLYRLLYSYEIGETVSIYVRATSEDATYADSANSNTITYTVGMFGQGVPLILPIDKNAAVKAVITDSKISEGLYEALGVDTKKLKNTISSEITRGIAAGLPHSDIARNIAAYAKAPLSRAKTIVRTESHRIQQASAFDAQKVAVSKGAKVVKQWMSTLDGNTRPTHKRLDGQIRELDEPFEMGGLKAMYPGDFGDPAEDCNCRCQLLQRARIALDADELKTLQDRAGFFGLDKSDDFADFKKKYLKAAEKVDLPLEKSVKSGKIESEKIGLQFFAKMPEEKFTSYSLNPEKAPDKAKAFKEALGYDLSNYSELMQNINDHIDESKFVEKGDIGYGMRYEYVLELEGVNGKKANVLTAWIQDGDEKRLTSVYVTEKKVTE